eukprot:g15612.t1
MTVNLKTRDTISLRTGDLTIYVLHLTIDWEKPSPSRVTIHRRIETEGHPRPTEWRTPTPLHTAPFSYCSTFWLAPVHLHVEPVTLRRPSI